MAGICAIALMMLFTVTAKAQDNVPKVTKEYTAYLKSQLSLNDSQYGKVYEIISVYLEKDKKNNESGTAAEKAKKHKAQLDDRDKKMESVLSKEQFKIYVANRAANARKLKDFTEAK